MYKYWCVLAVSMVPLQACEFVNGVTIKDPEVSRLFATVEGLYSNNETVRVEIEDLYIQYLCSIASRDTLSTKPQNGTNPTVALESLIATHKPETR
jgi:hypothetical protein